VQRARLLLLAAIVATVCACTWDWDRFEPRRPHVTDPRRWVLAFDEECNGTSIDRTKWNTTFVQGGAFRKQSWSDAGMADENVSLSDGLCRIKLENRSSNGAPFTSGVMDSGNKFEQLHGVFEARVKMARGAGFRSTFLLSSSDTWPPQIDVARVSGGNTRRAGHVVWWHDAQAGSDANVQLSTEGSDFGEDFHVFSVVWTPDEIAFYVDGLRTNGVARSTAAKLTTPLKFELTAHIVGDGSDKPETNTGWPYFMSIDWVRAFKPADGL